MRRCIDRETSSRRWDELLLGREAKLLLRQNTPLKTNMSPETFGDTLPETNIFAPEK